MQQDLSSVLIVKKYLVHDGWMTIDEEIDVSQVAEEEDFRFRGFGEHIW